MIREELEVFLVKTKSKTHVMEILPYYSLRCCLLTNDEKSIFTLSKDSLVLLEDAVTMDLTIEGSSEDIIKLLKGTKMINLKTVSFKGTFRHYLLMDSLFTLVNHTDRRIVS
jgi:hypothetical protein